MWVLDATPLIYLAKGERLDVLDRLDRSRLVPERVYDEVVTAGLEEGYSDARRIERRVEDGAFEIGSPEASELVDRLASNPNLSEADAAVLAIAAEVDGTAVMDERYGRDVADAEGIETREPPTSSVCSSNAAGPTPKRPGKP